MRWDNLTAVIAAGPPKDHAQSAIAAYSGAETIDDVDTQICACFAVGEETVRRAVQSGAAKSVADIARMLQAGSNCGSCLPELKRTLLRTRAALAAAKASA
jgi:assimilatory nitrate reductase catalytic subunit